MNVLRKILKNKTFFIPIEKSDTKWKIKSIDSTRFMAISSSNLVDNLAEGINKIKCKDCDCFLEYENVKDDLIKYKCLSCHKDCLNKLDEESKE